MVWLWLSTNGVAIYKKGVAIYKKGVAISQLAFLGLLVGAKKEKFGPKADTIITWVTTTTPPQTFKHEGELW